MPTFEGKNVFRGYRKRYGVDWPTALRELEMLGGEVDPACREQVLRTVQEQAKAKKRRQLKKAAEIESVLQIEQDEHFAFIVGYTPGGAPYGITWEEWEAMEDEDDEPKDRPIPRCPSLSLQKRIAVFATRTVSRALDTTSGVGGESNADNIASFPLDWPKGIS